MLGETDWNSTTFPKNFVNFDWISSKTYKTLRNSGIPKDVESAVFGMLHKLLLSFLEILKFLGTQFSVVHRGGGGAVLDIFWNSPMHPDAKK